jgi:hypothetical protein
MFDLIAANVRLVELEKQKRDLENNIKDYRNEREFSEDQFRKNELTKFIEASKSDINKLKESIRDTNNSINNWTRQKTIQEQQSQQKATAAKAAVSKLSDVNASQFALGKKQEDLGKAETQQAAIQNAANISAPAPKSQTEQQQAPAAAYPAFTKFSGLGATQMRQQQAAPPQNVTGTTQNAFTLPNAQGLKFGGA